MFFWLYDLVMPNHNNHYHNIIFSYQRIKKRAVTYVNRRFQLAGALYFNIWDANITKLVILVQIVGIRMTFLICISWIHAVKNSFLDETLIPFLKWSWQTAYIYIVYVFSHDFFNILSNFLWKYEIRWSKPAEIW